MNNDMQAELAHMERIGDMRYAQDKIGGVDWAFLPDSIFSLARFTSTGKVFLVANATKPSYREGSFIPVSNPRFEYAESFKAFKDLAESFVAESVS